MADEPAMLVSDQTGAALVGISRASFWRRVNDGTFPKPLKIGGSTRWRRDELLAVIEAASAARPHEAA
ncbi:MAG: AlpA family phage regulatory protein [Amaricoccus sp.]